MILVHVVQGKNLRHATELKFLSNDKKDLTRIEDLGEYLHELNSEEDFQTEELPDLPVSEEESSFDSPPDTPDFGSSEESQGFSVPTEDSETDFGTSFESSLTEETFSNDFGSTEDSTFETSNEEPMFESSAFGDVEEEVKPFEETPKETVEEPSWNTEETLTQEVPDTSFDEPEPLKEVIPVETYEPPKSEFKTPENFEDLKKFSESSSFTGMATEGNPSFSVLIKNVRYIEDVNDILSLLREFNLLTDSEDVMKGRLMRGTLLVPRISEFAAILLSHKLRKFDIDIQLGLSDEIHPPKHHETPETGIVSKHNLYQNQSHHFHFDDPKLEISQIIVSATSNLEGYQVVKYMGIASEHKMLEASLVEDENSSEVPAHYQELAQKLKAHALKANSNAVVGLNYQLTPIPSEYGMSNNRYRLTCTGNLVWVNKL